MADTLSTDTAGGSSMLNYDPNVATYLKQIADILSSIDESLKNLTASSENTIVKDIAEKLYENNYCDDGQERIKSKGAISRAKVFYKMLKKYDLI